MSKGDLIVGSLKNLLNKQDFHWVDANGISGALFMGWRMEICLKKYFCV